MKFAIMYRPAETGETWEAINVIADTEESARRYVIDNYDVIGNENIASALFSATTLEYQNDTTVETVTVAEVMTTPEHHKEDLALYAINTGDLYRGTTGRIMDRLALDMVRYTYTDTAAVKAFQTAAAEAARLYKKEFPESVSFTPAEVKQAAADMLEHYKEEITERAEAARGPMETFPDLLKKARDTMAQVEKLKKEIDTRTDEMCFDARAGRFRKSETHELFTAEEKKRLDHIQRLEDKKINLQLTAAFLKNNARLALFHDNAPAILEIWEKYQGKPYGEKTASKIRDEMKTATGCYVYLNRDYSGRADGLHIAPENNRLSRDYDVEAHTAYNSGNKEYFLSPENKIQAVPLDILSVSYINRRYIYDIPAAVKEARRRYDHAAELQAELRTACSAYTLFQVDGMPTCNERESIGKFYMGR